MWVLLLVEGLMLLLVYRHFGVMALKTVDGIQRDGIPVGESAPTLLGVTSTGDRVSWEPAGRPKLLIFALPDCGPCARVLPFLSQFARVNQEVELAVVTSGPRDEIARVVDKFHPPFTSLADDGSGAFDRYRVRVTPFCFVLGEDGRVQAKGLCSDPFKVRDLLATAGFAEAADQMERVTKGMRAANIGIDNLTTAAASQPDGEVAAGAFRS